MRKFFQIIMFVICTISLVAMTGCGENGQVLKQCDTDTYSYTIICVRSGFGHFFFPFFRPGKYTFEFKGGNFEQRQAQSTMLLYKRGVTEDSHDAYAEIQDCLEQLQNKQ